MTYLLLALLTIIGLPVAVVALAFLSALIQGETLYAGPIIYQRRPKP